MSPFHDHAGPSHHRRHSTHEDNRRASSRVAPGATPFRLGRRAAVRLLAGGALAIPAALQAPSSLAIKGWCRRDPIVKIGDLTVQLILSSDAAIHSRATGPTQIVVQVPPGIATEFVADDPGFGRFGYDVRFIESHELVAGSRFVGVVLDAYVPAADAPEGPLPLVLECYPRGDGEPVVDRAEGLANEWVSLRASLAARLGESEMTPADVPYTEARARKNRRKKRSR